MKPIHKLRIFGIASVFALLCYLVVSRFHFSTSTAITVSLIAGGVGTLGVLFFAVSSFLNRHSGKGRSTVAPWLSEHMLTNGIKVLVSKTGNGRAVRRGRRVVINYSAWHSEVRKGTLFDTTDGKAPLEFVCGAQSPKGAWLSALDCLKAGAKVRLIVPSHLGFGAKGFGTVPPNARLYFDVEVVSVKYND